MTMDTNSTLRTGATDLTADETLTSVRVGPMTRPMWLIVIVPEVSSGDTLDVELEFCDASASTTQVQNMNMAQISAAGVHQLQFITPYEYLQVKLNETDNGGPDFGAVKVYLSPGPVHPDGKQS
jgi:hypothetical protein